MTRRLAALVSALLALAMTAPARASPDLRVPRPALARALVCPGRFGQRGHEPVLLVHGTGGTPEENWGWNYAKVLPGLGYDVCTVRLPNRALDDIQVSSEYVVYAIRAIAAKSGRKVEVMGHSQGGLEPRWALRWWPDLRRLTDDLVTLATPNHGAAAADAVPSGTCTEACYQMRTTARFIAALNSRDETPGPVSYTSLYSRTDELAQPASSPPVAGGRNLAVQDLCPGRPVEHAAMAADAAVFATVIDAFTHAGPADPGRVDRAVCGQGMFPGADPAMGFRTVIDEGSRFPPWPYHPASGEPALAPYARGNAAQTASKSTGNDVGERKTMPAM